MVNGEWSHRTIDCRLVTSDSRLVTSDCPSRRQSGNKLGK
jgi:hypothetical protein